MIIYFSGTGNSRALAKTAAECLGDELFSAPDAIRAGKTPDFSSEKPYVFICPTYAWRIPRVFESFIRKCRFSGNKTAYFILTCGSDIGAARKYTRALAAEKGFTYAGTLGVLMPENYIAIFRAPDEKNRPRAGSARQGNVRTRLRENCGRRSVCRKEAVAAGRIKKRRGQSAVLSGDHLLQKIPRDGKMRRLRQMRATVHAE